MTPPNAPQLLDQRMVGLLLGGGWAVAHPRPAPAHGRTRSPVRQRMLVLHLLHDWASCGRLGYFFASTCFKTALSSSEQVVEPLGFLFQFTQPLGLIDV
jgi:hypothetical protein